MSKDEVTANPPQGGRTTQAQRLAAWLTSQVGSKISSEDIWERSAGSATERSRQLTGQCVQVRVLGTQ